MTTATGTAADRWKGLATQVRAARTGLGLSARAAALRAGLDPRTWQRIEAGEPVQERRLDALDEALGWEPGGSRAFLRGQVEHPADHRPPRPADRDDIELLLELRRAARAVDELSGELLTRLGGLRR